MTIKERRGLELYRELKKLYKHEYEHIMSIGYAICVEQKMAYYGSSKADKTAGHFDEICGTLRPLDHKRNIEDVMTNKKRKNFVHKSMYEGIVSRIDNGNHHNPNGLTIDVLMNLAIDPVIFEACIQEAMQTRNLEYREYLLNTRGEIMPIKAIEIVDSIEKEIDLGNFFLECLSKIETEIPEGYSPSYSLRSREYREKKRAKALETGSKPPTTTTNASLKTAKKGDEMFGRPIVNMALIIEDDSIVERVGLELYQQLVELYKDEYTDNRSCSVGYRFVNEIHDVYYGGSNHRKHSTLGSYRIYDHRRNIAIVLNGGELADDKHGPFYNEIVARISKANYPNGFHIDVLNDLKIDSLIFEACIYRWMKSQTNYIERRKQLIIKRCEIVPIKALRILDTTGKVIALGNYFVECLSRITEENKNVTNKNKTTLPRYSRQVTDINLVGYCIVCKKQGKITKFTNTKAISDHFFDQMDRKEDKEHIDHYNDAKPEIHQAMHGSTFYDSLIDLTPPSTPSIETKKKHKCDECDRSYTHHDNLVRHKKQNHSLEPPPRFPCSFCTKTFVNNSDRKRHEKNLHPQTEIPKFRCGKEGCSYETKNEWSLKLHQKRHTRKEKSSLQSSDLVKKSKFRFCFALW